MTAYIKRWMNTSVTMLSMPSIRLDVPNLDGFPDTADKTFWTNAMSWTGSAQIGPPICREDAQLLWCMFYIKKNIFRHADEGCVYHLMSLSTVLTLWSNWRAGRSRIFHTEMHTSNISLQQKMRKWEHWHYYMWKKFMYCDAGIIANCSASQQMCQNKRRWRSNNACVEQEVIEWCSKHNGCLGKG